MSIPARLMRDGMAAFTVSTVLVPAGAAVSVEWTVASGGNGRGYEGIDTFASIENEDDVGEEQQQMHRSLHRIGSTAAEIHHADRERHHEQDQFHILQAEFDCLSGGQPDHEYRGDG